MEVRSPERGEVLVEIRASGICHTDLAAVRDARTYPIVLGHEGAGVVAAVGEGVAHVAPGDHVVINWQPKCGQCVRCQSGRSDLCERIAGTSTPNVFWRGKPIAVLLQAGTFCSAVLVPAAGAVPIRRDLPFAEAALLGCAVATGVGAALFTADVQPAQTVAVLGTGGVGLKIVQGARLAAASCIVAVDISHERLAMATTFGATETFNAHDPDLVEKVRDVTGGRGMDFVFEVVGLPSLMHTGIDMLRRGGELILVGAAARDAELSFLPRRFMSMQQAVRGSISGNIRPAVHLPFFADCSKDGRLNVRDLISQTVTLEEVPERLQAFVSIRPLYKVSGTYGPERSRRYARGLRSAGGVMALVRTPRAMIAEQHASWISCISSLGIATKIIWGAQDPAVPLENAYKFRSMIPASDLTVIACGHVAQEEASQVAGPLIHRFLSG